MDEWSDIQVVIDWLFESLLKIEIEKYWTIGFLIINIQSISRKTISRFIIYTIQTQLTSATPRLSTPIKLFFKVIKDNIYLFLSLLGGNSWNLSVKPLD